MEDKTRPYRLCLRLKTKQFLTVFPFLGEVTTPLGKILINNVNDLTKVGTALQKDYKDPSLFDLEDVQDYDNRKWVHLRLLNLRLNY